jgi:hypothetical protein
MAKNRPSSDSNRITVTLAPHQRDALELIAKENETTLAFVVRYALKRFIEDQAQGQLRLEFPARPANR